MTAIAHRLPVRIHPDLGRASRRVVRQHVVKQGTQHNAAVRCCRSSFSSTCGGEHADRTGDAFYRSLKLNWHTDVLSDQRLGGVIGAVGGVLAMLTVIAVLNLSPTGRPAMDRCPRRLASTRDEAPDSPITVCVTLVIGLSACSDTNSVAQDRLGSSGSAAIHNDADATFLQQTILHNTHALEMSKVPWRSLTRRWWFPSARVDHLHRPNVSGSTSMAPWSK